MIIHNGWIFGEDRKFIMKDLYIEHGIIVSDASQVTDKTVIDASGCYVIPGLIDIHSHGACGYDFSDANEAGLHEILRYQREHGITSYCPTSMTLPKEQLHKIFQTAKTVKSMEENSQEEATLVGLNMEGPFIDAKKKGAHAEEYIIEPDVEFFQKCNESCGELIRLVTIAPNRNGAMEFIRKLSDKTTISLGHTSADYDTSRKAIEAGAHHVTHLYNAMLPMEHRAPGLIGAAAEEEHVMAELICDGIHVHESMVRAAFKLFSDRIVLISDSNRATGLKDGTYELGGQEVTVAGKIATIQDGTIAGSVTNLFDCMLTAISFGIPPETAIAAATMNPAKSIGIYDTVGSLTVGKKADVLIVNQEYELIRVI